MCSCVYCTVLYDYTLTHSTVVLKCSHYLHPTNKALGRNHCWMMRHCGRVCVWIKVNEMEWNSVCLMTSHWKFYKIFRLKNGLKMGFSRWKKNRSFKPYKWTIIQILESYLAMNFFPQIIRDTPFKISQNFHFADMQFTIKRIEWTRPYGNCLKFTAHTALRCVCLCVCMRVLSSSRIHRQSSTIDTKRQNPMYHARYVETKCIQAVFSIRLCTNFLSHYNLTIRI